MCFLVAKQLAMAAKPTLHQIHQTDSNRGDLDPSFPLAAAFIAGRILGCSPSTSTITIDKDSSPQTLN